MGEVGIKASESDEQVKGVKWLLNLVKAHETSQAEAYWKLCSSGTKKSNIEKGTVKNSDRCSFFA